MNERKLTKSELTKREDIIMNMKGNKRDLVKKYGADAEKVMYGRATNMAKKQSESMDQTNARLKEMVKTALKNPKKINSKVNENSNPELDRKVNGFVSKLADLYDYSLQDAVHAIMGVLKSQNYDGLNEESTSRKKGLKIQIKDVEDSLESGESDGELLTNETEMLLQQELKRLKSLLNSLGEDISEDLDLGHEDNEPHMLKADLYRIGKYAMELYGIVNDFEGKGEVDFPSWWQAKITNAKTAIVGAKHYLDFEINEPSIDTMVDTIDTATTDDDVVDTDVLDVDIDESQLGTDDDTGFTRTLYTPNEMGDASVGSEYASGAFEENQKPINETMNMNKWRRAYNGKAFAKKTVYLEDYSGNKKRYTIYFKYQETPSKDIVSLKESHYGNHEGSGMPFAMSNLQNKPAYLFTSDDKMEFDTEEQFDDFVDDGAKGLESLLSFFLGGKNVDSAIKAWFDTGVTDKSKMRIGPAEYFEGAKVDESISKYSTIAEKLAKELKEGLPKGFWDKKIDAKDEDQDGKIDEGSSMRVTKQMWQKMSDDEKENALLTVFEDPDTAEKWIGREWESLPGSVTRDMHTESINEDLRGLMAQGEKMAAFANKQSGYEGGVSSPVRNVLAAATVAGAPNFNGDEDLKAYWTRRLTKAIETQKGKKYMSGFSIDESYATVVNKIKKSGKSEKSAKAIAGAVASYKAKGGGKGPTAKQK